MKTENAAKGHYQRLRALPCARLWAEEVAAFDHAKGRERIERVAAVRAVGVVFSELGTSEEKERAREWLRGLLHDPEEKIRRYAMRALPKLGVDEREEAELLALAEKAATERERKHLGRTLEKIGGGATLAATDAARLDFQTLRKVRANVARAENPAVVRMDRILADVKGLRIHLNCRSGLEEILDEEVREHLEEGAPFRLGKGGRELVVLEPIRPFTLDDVFSLRCFSSMGILWGEFTGSADEAEDLAAAIASPSARRVLEAFTEGPIRYRLEFASRGHQRAAVRRVADRVYSLCPALLNDSRNAPWQIDIREGTGIATFLELTPKLRPDPRFAWRRGDVPAASHPPLAAAMARLAGREEDEIVWDPFCGSGLELIERALRGGVRKLIGTDRSAEALETARQNVNAALNRTIPTTLWRGDFRNCATENGMERGSISLVITNPPMGRRVPIPNLKALIEDLFATASDALRPRGRLVFVNPLPVQPRGLPLRRVFRREVDLGGFHAHLEKYVRDADDRFRRQAMENIEPLAAGHGNWTG